MDRSISVTKSILAKKYNLSNEKMAKLLNNDYFEELEKVGYKKDKRNILSPHVVREFIRLYGEPITNELIKK
jgi:hypothetical protein